MIEWVLERLAPQVSQVIVNANQNLERYEKYGHRVVRDEIGGFAGPSPACTPASRPQRTRSSSRCRAIRRSYQTI